MYRMASVAAKDTHVHTKDKKPYTVAEISFSIQNLAQAVGSGVTFISLFFSVSLNVFLTIRSKLTSCVLTLHFSDFEKQKVKYWGKRSFKSYL